MQWHYVREQIVVVAVVRPQAFLNKKQALTQALSGEFCEIFQTSFCTEHLRVSASVI